jgi:hypothetical protein
VLTLKERLPNWPPSIAKHAPQNSCIHDLLLKLDFFSKHSRIDYLAQSSPNLVGQGLGENLAFLTTINN